MKNFKKPGIAAFLAIPLFFGLILAQGGPQFGNLVIPDTSMAAWMTINNTFSGNHELNPWEGVLIQLGDYFPGDEVFFSVSFENKGKPVGDTLLRGDFTWINIVAKDPSKAIPPMNLDDVFLLLPDVDPNVQTSCDSVDDCAFQNSCIQTDEQNGCLRKRSLHGLFTPVAVITYWQGPNGFDLSVGPLRKNIDTHHIFTFRDIVEIEIYHFPDASPQPLGFPVDTILINADPGINHGDHDDPPWPTPKP